MVVLCNTCWDGVLDAQARLDQPERPQMEDHLETVDMAWSRVFDELGEPYWRSADRREAAWRDVNGRIAVKLHMADPPWVRMRTDGVWVMHRVGAPGGYISRNQLDAALAAAVYVISEGAWQ